MSDQLLLLGLLFGLALLHRGTRRLIGRILGFALRETVLSVARGTIGRRRRRAAAPARRRKAVKA